MANSKTARQPKKTTRKAVAKNTASGGLMSEDDPAFREILELAKSLQAIHKQVYKMIRPVINDACKNPQTVSEHKLGHLFDQVLDISCTDYGMSLFTLLCNTFKEQYPEAVADYIKINNEFLGDDEPAPDATQRSAP